VAAQNANSLDLFMRGSDNAVRYNYWTGTTWTALTSLSGNVTSDPAATSRAAGYMDVFARGTDGALWSKSTTNNGTSWSNWYKIGGQLASGTGPAADARGPNSLDVFVQGPDQALWYSHWDGTKWSAWTSLGGTLTSSPQPHHGLLVRSTSLCSVATTASGGTPITVGGPAGSPLAAYKAATTCPFWVAHKQAYEPLAPRTTLRQQQGCRLGCWCAHR
jgi:hypothetical protein